MHPLNSVTFALSRSMESKRRLVLRNLLNWMIW